MLDSIKDRLKRIIQKKILTSFVGAIASFEKEFPDLIGTEKWNRLRQEIMDLGNRQIRGVNSELDLHEIKFVGYKTKLAIKER
jgi:hypothetical protein